MSDPHFTRSKSKFGKWLDLRSIYPPDFATRFRIDLDTLVELVYEANADLPSEVRTKLRDAIREIDPTVNTYDFWQNQVPEQMSSTVPPQS